MSNINYYYVIIISFSFLSLITLTNCNKKIELTDNEIIGEWQSVSPRGKSDERAEITYLKFNSDHSLNSYRLSYGHKSDETVGTWQLVKKNNLNSLFFSTREYSQSRGRWKDERTGESFVELVGDTLIFSSTKSGKRETAWIKSNE